MYPFFWGGGSEGTEGTNADRSYFYEMNLNLILLLYFHINIFTMHIGNLVKVSKWCAVKWFAPNSHVQKQNKQHEKKNGRIQFGSYKNENSVCKNKGH